MKKFLMMACMAIACGTMITGCGSIDSDEVGFKTSFGRVDSQVLNPGLYGINPIGGALITYSARENLLNLKTAAYTKDAQTTTCKLAIRYRIDPRRVIELHTEYGPNFARTIIEPQALKAIKNVVGQWDSIELISGRTKATAEIDAMIKKLIHTDSNAPIIVNDVTISDIEYTDVFEKAIEAKMVASQRSLEAKNRTIQVEEECRQAMLKAETEAKAMQVKGDALRANQGLVELEAVNRWDGKMPNTLVVGDGGKTFLPIGASQPAQ